MLLGYRKSKQASQPTWVEYCPSSSSYSSLSELEEDWKVEEEVEEVENEEEEDITMVAEYSDEIFCYMEEREVCSHIHVA